MVAASDRRMLPGTSPKAKKISMTLSRFSGSGRGWIDAVNVLLVTKMSTEPQALSARGLLKYYGSVERVKVVAVVSSDAEVGIEAIAPHLCNRCLLAVGAAGTGARAAAGATGQLAEHVRQLPVTLGTGLWPASASTTTSV